MANPLLCRVVWLVSLVILGLVGTKSAAAFRTAAPRPSAGTSSARMSSAFTTSSFDESVESKEQPLQRRVEVEEKFARLPVWPVWQGVILFFAGKLLGETVAAEWEDRIGGRVCPNFFSSSSVVTDTIYGGTSPFVLLVHHRHAFMNWDPVRWLQKTFFAEGFPSHPHRGFVTVTYCLSGGMLHRDSMGIKQAYGAEQRHGGNHVQWLNTGSGMQHEEMWDVFEPDEKDEGSLLQTSSQELYQIWLNVPSSQKMTSPKAQLLQKYGVKDESDKPPPYSTPIITEGGVTTTVVCGDHNGIRVPWDIPTDAAILRVELTKGATWEHSMPASHKTAIIYVKSGFIEIEGDRIAPHHTAYLTQDGQTLTVRACDDSADILLLSGAPILEPVYSQGSMVMNSKSEIQKAYQDYQSGYMGVPWDYKLTDEEWQEHIKRYPSMY